VISWVRNLFITPEPVEPTPLELLETTLEFAQKVEDAQNNLSLCLSNFRFKEDFGTKQIQVAQMVDWNTRANFSHQSLYDELKIISQKGPVDGEKTAEI